MAFKSIKILCRIEFPDGSVFRFWDGSGPYLDAEGDLWEGAWLAEGTLDQIEAAMNGEASTLNLTMSAVGVEAVHLAYEDLEAGNVIGGKVQILTQPLDAWDQPDGDAEVEFTGRIDNMPSSIAAQGDNQISTITLEVVNRFDLRALVSGAVLSDVDQKARAKLLNPTAPLDRFCERIYLLIDKTVRWPRFS